jgi:hypothetical protein
MPDLPGYFGRAFGERSHPEVLKQAFEDTYSDLYPYYSRIGDHQQFPV